VYHHPALVGALVRDREAELRHNAGAGARPRRTPRRPNVIAAVRLRTGWLLVDLGLRLAVSRGGTNHPVAGGRR